MSFMLLAEHGPQHSAVFLISSFVYDVAVDKVC